MTDSNESAVKVKRSWWKGLKSEFKKIVWPSKEDIVKQTVAVIVITTILAVVIGFLDLGLIQVMRLIKVLK